MVLNLEIKVETLASWQCQSCPFFDLSLCPVASCLSFCRPSLISLSFKFHFLRGNSVIPVPAKAVC